MPNMRGQGIPFILTQPWLLPRIPVDSTPTVIRDFPVGVHEQLVRYPITKVYARNYRSEPAVVAPAAAPFTARPTHVTLAQTRQVALTSSEFRQPFLFYKPPPRRTIAAGRPWWLSFRSTRRPPAVTAAAVVSNFPIGLSIQLVSRRLRRVATKSVFRPPVVVNQPSAPFLPAKPKVSLTQAYRQTRVRYTVKKPTVVGAATTFLPSPKRVQLARWQNAWYRIGLARPPVPTVVNPAAPTVPFRFTLAAGFFREARRTHSFLRPPTVVNASIGDVRNVPVSIQTQLVRRPPYPRQVTHTLRPPVVVGPFATTTLQQRTPRIGLAPWQWQRRPTRSTLRPPVVVNPFVPSVVTVQGGTDWAAVITSW